MAPMLTLDRTGGEPYHRAHETARLHSTGRYRNDGSGRGLRHRIDTDGATRVTRTSFFLRRTSFFFRRRA
jgi:hypothetical protein